MPGESGGDSGVGDPAGGERIELQARYKSVFMDQFHSLPMVLINPTSANPGRRF